MLSRFIDLSVLRGCFLYSPSRAFLQLCFLLLFVLASARAAGEVVFYHFTGSLAGESIATPGFTFGGELSGVLSIETDPSAPTFIDPERATWLNHPGFSISLLTSSGYYHDSDAPTPNLTSQNLYYVSEERLGNHNSRSDQIRDLQLSQSLQKQASFETFEAPAVHADGLLNLPDPWLLSQYTGGRIQLTYHDLVLNARNVAGFTVTGLELLTQEIAIGDCETGIDDFEVEGRLFSEWIEDLAAAAKNHGKFVSGLTKLLNEAKKEGLIDDVQKDVLMECIASANLP